MTVSILIPAFRPTYLRQAIASALTQGTDDFEIVVSDDSGGSHVRAVVDTFRDSRIRYVRTSGRIGAVENCRALWEECRTDFLLFLFDDDLLFPNAIVDLLDGLTATPGAAFAYGPRQVIDERGAVIRDATRLDRTAVFDEHVLPNALVGEVTNFVGELSNVLLDRRVGLDEDDLFKYHGLDMHVVTDVSLYLNACRKGAVVRTPRPVAAFRRHAAQNSKPEFNPRFAIGIAEWELFVRGELETGRLSHGGATKAAEKLSKAYENWSRSLPALGMMKPSLTRLRDSLGRGETVGVDEQFRTDWRAFVAAVTGGVS